MVAASLIFSIDSLGEINSHIVNLSSWSNYSRRHVEQRESEIGRKGYGCCKERRVRGKDCEVRQSVFVDFIMIWKKWNGWELNTWGY